MPALPNPAPTALLPGEEDDFDRYLHSLDNNEEVLRERIAKPIFDHNSKAMWSE